MTEPRVYFRHCRALKRNGGRIVCAPGIKALCERAGLDYEKFLVEGCPGEFFLADGGYFALLALEQARAEAADGQR